MLFSLALIFLVGMLLGSIFVKLKMPSLVGMLFTGILLGPYVLNLLSPGLLSISGDLREISLIIILTRAGLNLDINDLKKVGRPALLMCAIPSTLEIIGMLILAPKFLGMSLVEAGILGTVVAAVSPAVVVPTMLKIMDEGYGVKKGIPQMVMAGASVDNVYVIVLFTAFTGFATGHSVSSAEFLKIPTAIIFGLIGGIVIGKILLIFFEKFHLRDSAKVLIILSISFMLVTLEFNMKGIIGFSGLLGIMALGGTIQKYKAPLAERLSAKYSSLWVAAEICLFVLVGATVNISYVKKAGLFAVALILCVLAFRMFGVFLSMLKTQFNTKERIFTMVAYTPKATVQAAIGAMPLAMGLACGNTVLTVAVMSILITAPFGATAINMLYKKMLIKSN